MGGIAAAQAEHGGESVAVAHVLVGEEADAFEGGLDGGLMSRVSLAAASTASRAMRRPGPGRWAWASRASCT